MIIIIIIIRIKLIIIIIIRPTRPNPDGGYFEYLGLRVVESGL